MSEPASRDPDADKVVINRKQFPCPQCGGAMGFIPGTHNLRCPYCGTESQIPEITKNADGSIASSTKLRELDYHEFIDRAEAEQTREKKVHLTHCNGCGANITLADHVSAENCPYCGIPVVAQDFVQTAIEVQGLLPFQINKENAYVRFGAWLKSLWFAPNNLTARTMRDGVLNGVYTPYWTYDSKTTTTYAGERGEYYYTTETYADANGRRQTRQVRHTRWYPTHGTVSVNFDDVLVPATKSLPRSLIENLEPWDLQNLEDFQAEFLSGYRAETYQIGLRDGFDLAEQKMAPVIRSAIIRDIGGDEQRILSSTTQHADVTFKHILMPLWISAYRYRERTFRFVINGRTGEVQGERPYSWVKITLFVLTCLAAAGIGIYYLSQME